MFKAIFVTGAFLVLTACGGNTGLRDLSTDSAGPDEFSVIPQRPLEIPETLALPQPTPGGGNRADPNPTGDAIAALGGSQAAGFAGGAAVEDDIHHRPAAERLGRLVAEDPFDGVDDVGFTAAVGPDDADDGFVESDFGFVGEGLETGEGELG